MGSQDSEDAHALRVSEKKKCLCKHCKEPLASSKLRVFVRAKVLDTSSAQAERVHGGAVRGSCDYWGTARLSFTGRAGSRAWRAANNALRAFEPSTPVWSGGSLSDEEGAKRAFASLDRGPCPELPLHRTSRQRVLRLWARPSRGPCT